MDFHTETNSSRADTATALDTVRKALSSLGGMQFLVRRRGS